MDGDLAAGRPGANYQLKDEIRAYWSKRAETFDLSYGHKIRTEAELSAWAALLRDHGGLKAGDRVLDLAAGTGEVTRILLALGCSVDALDFAEPMLARARAKHAGAAVRFHLADAEDTMMPDAAYDAVVCRHLVWTLIDPRRAFADWLRVLKPGGVLVVADGDWVSQSRRARLLQGLSRLVDALAGTPATWDRQTHQRIMTGVHFRHGLRPPELEAMLRQAGFEQPRLGALGPVRRRQFASASWSERLRLLAAQGRDFILCARKPG